jgi:hypothetical protein
VKLSIPPLVLSEIVPPEITSAEQEVWYDGTGTPCAYGVTTDGRHWLHLPGLASFCFTNMEEEVRVVTQLPFQDDLIRDAYFRSVLPLALQACGTEVLHASAVHASRGIVALCAASGTGKSTLTVGLHQRGYRMWADDAVAIVATGECVIALPFPFTLRLRPDAAAFFATGGFNMSQELSQASAAEEQRESRPLVALFLLDRVQDGNDRSAAVEILRISPAQAFPAVLAHAYCFSLRDTHRKQHMVRRYLDLVARVPTYSVRFRAGLGHLTANLDGIEQVLQDDGEE